MDNRTNIKQYTDRELSLLVFNTQDLYSIRHSDILINRLRREYIFTNKQLLILLQDLKADKLEVYHV